MFSHPRSRVATLFIGVILASHGTVAHAGIVLSTGNSTRAVTAYNFGYVLVGQQAGVTVNARNSGATALTAVSLPTITGSFNSGPGGIVANLAAGRSTSRQYNYNPTQRGAQSQTITATGHSGRTTVSTNLHFTAQGVAPVEQVQTTGAGLVRIGTIGQGMITLTNTGDGNLSRLGATSNLNGTIPSQTIVGPFTLGNAAPFSLTDHASQTFVYAYVPTAHQSDYSLATIAFANGSADGKNQASNVQVLVSGQGVGPTFHSSAAPGSTFDFGHIENSSKSLSLQIGNISTDLNGGHSQLTDLSLLNAKITGPNASSFSIAGLSHDVILHEGGSGIFDVNLNGKGPGWGWRYATLTITTDQNAAFGLAGTSFSYELKGFVAPEPASIVLAGLGGFGLLLGGWQRRKKTAQAPMGA